MIENVMNVIFPKILKKFSKNYINILKLKILLKINYEK
jgi:hypothetical protein